MRQIALVPALVTALSLGACANDYGEPGGNDRHGYSDRDRDRHSGRRDDDRRAARERRQLGKKDRVYRDRDGRYYCRRRDGSRGAIVGALTGGVLGNIIAPGDSMTLGAIIDAGGGAFAGRTIDRKNIRCE